MGKPRRAADRGSFHPALGRHVELPVRTHQRQSTGGAAAMTYEVVVGGVGTVTKTRRPALAADVFNDYMVMSKANLGRAGLQPVYLLKGGEPTWEFHPEVMARERLRDAVMKAIEEA